MECYYHPNKEGINTCAICGKSVCEECSLEIAGKMYCKECLEKIVGIGSNNESNEKNSEVESKPEPVRLGKKEESETSIYQIPKEETPTYHAVKENSNQQTPKKEKTIFANDLSIDLDQPKENNYSSEKSSIYDTTTQADYYKQKEDSIKKPIASDSPYNIGMGYSEKVEEKPKTYFKKESAPYLDPHTNINQDYNINQNINNNQETQRQSPQNEYNYYSQEPTYNQQESLRQKPQSAQNEFDYYPQEQVAPKQQAPQEYIYPDHTFEPEETSARKALEDKYEKYLDDLYFDEPEVPLEEQLAKDEEEYGSLTKKPYVPPTPQQPEEYMQQRESYTPQTMENTAYSPQTPRKQENIPQNNEAQMYAQQNYYPQEERRVKPKSYEEEKELDKRIRDQLNIRKEQTTKSNAHHNIKYEEEGKESFDIIDFILTIILIIAILVVLFYIIYLFFLTNSYPTFLDALFALQNPGDVINNLMK